MIEYPKVIKIDVYNVGKLNKIEQDSKMNEESKGFILGCCGLVCTQCGAYLKQRCQGCHSDKPMSMNCKVKPCVQEKNCNCCAECSDFENLKECTKLDNFISKIFGFIFRSNRMGNLDRIRKIGLDKFKEEKRA